MGNNLENSVKGKKLTNIQSSKFCTGRHLQYYNETIQLLAKLASWRLHRRIGTLENAVRSGSATPAGQSTPEIDDPAFVESQS